MKIIKEAAVEYSKILLGDSYSVKKGIAVRNAFEAGVQFAQHWIPVEEELPEDEQCVFVMYKNCIGGISYQATECVDGKWLLNGAVIAWRPIEIN